jgi:hypothetical protein
MHYILFLPSTIVVEHAEYIACIVSVLCIGIAIYLI